MAVQTFRVELPLDHVLGGNPGVVGSRHPEDIVPFQPPVAGQDILEGVVQCVAHMQGAGDVGWRNYHGKWRPVAIGTAGKTVMLFPELIPFIFNQIGVVGFIQIYRFVITGHLLSSSIFSSSRLISDLIIFSASGGMISLATCSTMVGAISPRAWINLSMLA